uniref:Arylesterase n=1 Tax=Heterorhabditis bacteriophora TaxID=37862 RepID=A0A1I7XP36_HETBA
MLSKLIVLAILAAIGAYVFRLTLYLDVHKRVYNHKPGPCRQIEGIMHGSEDIVVIESEGIALISSGIFYMSPRAENVTGNIFLYDFNKSEYKVEPVTIKGDLDRSNFFPHGLSHFIVDGKIRLFVVVHSKQFEHSIMLFDYDKNTKTLTLIKIIKNDKFVRYVKNSIFTFYLLTSSYPLYLSDLMILSHYQWINSLLFYITYNINYCYCLKRIFIEYWLILSDYFNQDSHWLIRATSSPNGVIVDRKKEHLIVSHVNEEIIRVYKMAENYRSLSLVSEVPLLTSSDNFYIDEDGALWTGAHPVLKNVLYHLGYCDDLQHYGPSQVLRIVFSPDWLSWEVTEPYVDDGRQLSASSVAVHFRKQLLIGSVCRQLVHCDIIHRSTITN